MRLMRVRGPRRVFFFSHRYSHTNVATFVTVIALFLAWFTNVRTIEWSRPAGCQTSKGDRWKKKNIDTFRFCNNLYVYTNRGFWFALNTSDGNKDSSRYLEILRRICTHLDHIELVLSIRSSRFKLPHKQNMFLRKFLRKLFQSRTVYNINKEKKLFCRAFFFFEDITNQEKRTAFTNMVKF